MALWSTTNFAFVAKFKFPTGEPDHGKSWLNFILSKMS
jgi:hypothetical protein